MVDHYCVAPWRMEQLESAEKERDQMRDEVERLRAELARYNTPNVDEIEVK